MTNQTNWTAYDGSDEQISDIGKSVSGVIFGSHSEIWHLVAYRKNEIWQLLKDLNVKKYWLIPDDPLREMKVRQAMTGQPVWYKHRHIEATGECGVFHHPFIQPETYEYSFTEFKD